jgi:L-lactate dehydrogenase complex protein LldG
MQILRSSKTREKILGLIRKATASSPLPMPYPEVEKELGTDAFTTSEFSDEENFAAAFIKLGGKFVFCYNEADLAENLHILYENSGWKKLLCSDAKLQEIFREHKLLIAEPMDKGSSEADACITACEAIVGRTGTILFSSRQFMGRTSTVYYPIHIVVAYAHQAVSDVNAGMELMKQKYGAELPSMINFNTGPSRTADIEKTLVVGVHGPAEVYCFYVNA